MFKVFVDNLLGKSGLVVVALCDEYGEIMDQENILKHPFGLRIRCRLAMRRLRVRARKLSLIRVFL